MKPISVHALNGYVKALFDRDYRLQDVTIRGEISNYRPHPSGHMYFTLKDEQAAVNSVMFASYANKLNFKAENGMKVIVHAHVSVYEKTGVYQLYVDHMEEDGIGELAIQYAKLKAKLEAEGYFDNTHKKPIPTFPKNIAILSAKQGAALQDVLRTLKNRFPSVPLYIFPIPVQGKDAYKHIVNVLRAVDKAAPSTILLVRGGGSIEDLWNFNEEELVKCIYSLNTPIITGVGHDTDTTLVDYVADLACITPTAAATAAVPDADALRLDVSYKKDKLNHYMQNYVGQLRSLLEKNKNSYVLKNPQHLYENDLIHLDHNREVLAHIKKAIVDDKRNELNSLNMRLADLSHAFVNDNKSDIGKKRELLTRSMQLKIKEESTQIERMNERIHYETKKQNEMRKEAFLHKIEKLDLVNPLKILTRGYSIVKKDDKVVDSANTLSKGDCIDIVFNDGTKKAIVE